jgi:hypothetical protein
MIGDQTILLFARRFPQLMSDLRAWTGHRPGATRAEPTQSRLIVVPAGRNDFLLNCTRAAGDLARLGQVGNNRPLVHLFHSPAALLQFIASDGAEALLRHPRWHALLMLPVEHAPHLRAWFEQEHPRDWPWPLLGDAVPTGPVAEPASELGRRLKPLLDERAGRLSRRLIDRYRDHPSMQEILRRRSRPLRILVCAPQRSAYQRYCGRDVVDALGECGASAELAILPDAHWAYYELLERLEREQPDALFAISKGREQYVGLPDELAVLTWDQDHACVSDARFHQAMRPRDRLMVMVADWLDELDAYDGSAGRAFHLNMGANPSIYHPPDASPEPLYDVLFVGHIHPFETYKRLIGFEQYDPATREVLLLAKDQLGEWIDAREADEPFIIPDIDRLLLDAAADTSFDAMRDRAWRRRLAQYFRYRLAHYVVREKYVRALCRFRLGLFGNGWDVDEVTKPHAQPPIENGPALRNVIHRSGINVHLHTWTVHHPRLYDAAAAGGFLLVGRVPEARPLDQVFTPGDELETFGSIAEMTMKIRHLLEHEPKRGEMAQRAAYRAQRDHTMHRRMDDMIRRLQDHDPHREPDAHSDARHLASAAR